VGASPRDHAETNVQLYRQLERQGYALEAIVLARRAYEAASRSFAGRLQTSGRPFLCHLVGTASILAHVGRAPAVVAAGLVHSVYRGVDTSDGADLPGSPRARLADAVGADVEAHAFRASRTRRDYAAHRAPLERDDAAHRAPLDPADRDALAILLADELEKLASHNVLYGARADEKLARVRRKGADMIGLARALDLPALADELAARLDEVGRTTVPPALRGA